MKRQILLGVLILLFIQILAVAGDTYYVPSRDYPTIQSAISAAAFANDDVVVVAPGVYTGAGNVNLDFGGRAITVRSEINPDNPNPAIIAATIIDCGGEPAHNPLSDGGAWNRAFRFHSGEDPNSKVLGFTIRNGYTRGPKGKDGKFGYIGLVNALNPISLFVPIPPCADDPNNCPPYALDGDSRSGNGYGGAILCESASSPTIQYCVISDCTVTGAHGGDGADGLDGIWYHWTLGDIDPCTGFTDDVNNAPTENPDGQWAGSGGWGSGNGYGGAIACRGNSNPIISDCIISDNFARGGCSGDGGNGGNAAQTDPPAYDGLEGGGGDANNSIGDGIGGGIYSDGGSSPVITNCTFSNDIAMTGIRGTGGERGLGNEDDPRAPLGSDGLVYSTGGIAGGAAYYNTNSHANFTNCTFTSNKAYEAKRYKQNVPYPPYPGEDISAYTVGGALYSFKNSGVNLDNCKFLGNLGGAVYCGTGCNLDFDDCLFADNSETTNGGALYIAPGCTVNLQSCIFGGNSAYDDGGALKCESNATLTNCSFGSNRADSDNDGYGYGGAIDAYEPGTHLTIDFNACSFAGNQSIYGGGFSSERFDATFINCYFIGNTAQRGGGLDLVNGDISVTGGVVKGNNATDGDGGGFNCSYTKTEIRDCAISDNFADGVYPAGGSGGAINFYGGAPAQVVFNCLITGNFATINGGAMFCRNATPEIGNCIFSGNSAGDYGGAVFSDFISNPNITDSIFQNNNSHAIHEEDSGGDARARYCLFSGNPDGDYYDSGTGMTYSGPGQVGSIPGGSNNLYGNPLFVNGDLGGYYLRQIAAGQASNSPAIDNGSDTAANLGLDTYTTRTDNAGDAGQVDRGYHYPDSAGVGVFQLTASVIGGNGTIEPTSGTYYAGTVVTLTAEPNPGWRVEAWSGTDDDSSTATTNSVIMNFDRTVTVEFEQPKTLIVAVGGGEEGYYSTIQDAVQHSKDGDTIVVYPGIYYGGYFGVSVYVDKSITIRSMHPDDPCCVAATIIDGYNEYQFNEGYNNLGVTFGPHTNADTILNGFTIQNCGGYFGTGLDGDREENHPNGYEGGMGSGAAIRVFGGGPVIKNCVIRDNLVIGGNAGNGVGADDTHNAGRGGWGGYAWGGAIHCGTNSSPTFINCQIIDNYAQGGNGGDGGNQVVPGGYANYGGNWSMRGSPEYPVMDIDPYSLNITYVSDGDLWQIWGYIGDYRWYSGYGGGVYCDIGSNVTFTDCEISGNLAQGGVSGQGGEQAPVPRPLEPLIPYEIPSFGGGVYCRAESTVTFTGCTITDNVSSEPNENNSHIDPYLGHGGGVCAEDTATVIFTDCTFSENEAAVGGGIHFADANPIISDCNFTSNSAYQGGGLFGEHGLATILRSNFTNNTAFSDANDPNVLGQGGGLHFWATEADIIDCNISSNQAEASGGGVFFGGEGTPSLFNCLVTNNTAGRDGGGVSTIIFTQLMVSNCTIADNIVTGVGYGGGVYGSYGSYTNIVDSIIWGNSAYYGPQIGIGITVSPSTVEVSDSDVQGAQSAAYVEDDCSLIWDPNNLYTDPLFVIGPLGDYYLSQTEVGDPNQTVDSPCVDAGSGSAIYVGMSGYTTRTDELFDRGIVDMGYHHLFTLEVEECRVVDLFLDHFINFKDFAVFAWNWLRDDCSDDNGWCDGADVTFDGNVDWEDLEFYIGCWLVVDDDTPVPNPSEWAIEPYSGSPTSISMVAKTTVDTWGGDVEYYFECVYSYCHDSGWQSDPNYTDSGLDPITEYGYRVRAKDSRCGDISDLNCTFDPNDPNDPNAPNKTDWSDIRYAITPPPDTDPPSPAPVISSYTATSSSITLSATTASDESGVEYFFEDACAPDFNSGWIGEPTWTDVNLAPDTMYTYRVKARDMSPLYNETEWSPPFDANTLAEGEEPDTNAPSPAPVISSYTATSSSITLSATTASDESGVQYYFECITDDVNSGWIANPTWTDVNLVADTMYTYRVKARDMSPLYNETEWSPPFDANTLAEGEEPPPLQAPIIVGANQVEVGTYWHHVITARATAEDPLYFRFVCLNQSIFSSAWVPRVGNAVDTFDHPVVPEMPDPTITRGSDVITYDIAVGLSWNLWQWQVCGSNDPSGVPSLCSAPVAMPPPP